MYRVTLVNPPFAAVFSRLVSSLVRRRGPCEYPPAPRSSQRGEVPDAGGGRDASSARGTYGN